ncbi:hypothetical protein ACTQZS_08210 [Bilifractor sp. LCP19S3_H10]|uniref:hypothetical protein n=1 Tax=Bilifractor sp. LCP19S3_H10 TaxID=3438736 RepID=UPI003F910CD4
MDYNISFFSKWKRHCISEEVGEFFLQESVKILEGYHGKILSSAYGSNYLHLVISVPDDIDINKMTSGLTDQLETKLRRDPKLGNRNYYFGEPFSWGECHVTAIPVSKPEK